MPSQADWVAGLSPWPEEFGLGRMRALLAALGDPQLAYPAVHVVGSNGKSTATLTIEAYLRAAGLSVGSTISPHVRGFDERIRIDGDEADFERAVERVRSLAEREGATQFEALVAAALAEFAAREIDVAVVEAGLGGRHDATNVLRTSVVLLTNVSLEHTDVLGSTREAIAAEKLAVVQAGSVVVLPDLEFAPLAGPHVRVGGAKEAAEAHLGHMVEPLDDVRPPGRLEWRDRELRDGAHNLAGAEWLVAQLPDEDFTVVASILGDKDADAMLRQFARAGSRFVATTSSNTRALPAAELARIAGPHFALVEAIDDPAAALARAHELGEPVLVTGSLYLLADLAAQERAPA